MTSSKKILEFYQQYFRNQNDEELQEEVLDLQQQEFEPGSPIPDDVEVSRQDEKVRKSHPRFPSYRCAGSSYILRQVCHSQLVNRDQSS